MARALIHLGSVLLLMLLGFLTVSVLIKDGFTLPIAFSLFIIVLLGVGVLGALGTPPDD